MAYSFVKRPGAPAGTINISVAAGAFLIDDGANSIITTSNQKAADDLVLSPYLVIQGTPSPDPFSQPRATEPELAYAEWVGGSKTIVTSAAQGSSTACDDLVITVPAGTRPFMLEAFIPEVRSTAIARIGVQIWEIAFNGAAIVPANLMQDARCNIPAVNTGDKGTAKARVSRTPGDYTYKVYLSSVFLNNSPTLSIVGTPTSPAFITATER